MIANYSVNVITDVAIFYFLSKIGFTVLVKNSKLIQRFEHKHGNGLKTLTSQRHPIVRNLHETQIETGKKNRISLVFGIFYASFQLNAFQMQLVLNFLLFRLLQ